MPTETSRRTDHEGVLSLPSEELPAAFRTADAASLAAQGSYLRLLRLDLAAMVAGALLVSWSAADPGVIRSLAVATSVLLGISLALTLLLARRDHEGSWYRQRALAETLKSLSWRYVTGATPFGRELEPRQADLRFVTEVKRLFERLELPPWSMEESADPSPITATMREIRGNPLAERLDVFLRDRLKDQFTWYSTKSHQSRRFEGALFGLILTVQVLALLAAILLAAWPVAGFNPVGALTALAAALVAWLQVKRYQETAHSYAVAAAELGLVTVEARYVGDEATLAAFVDSAESAISREHSLWLARRGRQ